MDATAELPAETKPFDFRKSGILSQRQSRFLRQRHEEIARTLGDNFTLWLRGDCSLRLTRVEAVSYASFIGSLAEPTHITLFKIEPLRGVCLLETPPSLAIAVVERLLGGAAQRLGENRDLTEVEIAIFDQWAQIFIEEWQVHFSEATRLKPQILGHESAPRFLQSSPPDTTMVEVVFEVSFANDKVPVQLAIPVATLEPLLRQIASPEQHTPPAGTSAADVSVPWNAALDEMNVALSAHWVGLEMTAHELASLQVGEVVQLAPQLTGQVQVRLAGKPKFNARLGTCGGRWAVELTGATSGK